MNRIVCPVCQMFVSDWQVCTGKTIKINQLTIHNSCLEDWKLRHGTEWTLWEIAKQLSGG